MLKTETGNKMYGKEVIKLLLGLQGDQTEITEDVVTSPFFQHSRIVSRLFVASYSVDNDKVDMIH